MSDLNAVQSPLTAPQIAARLATLDAQTLARVLASFNQAVNRPLGLNLLFATDPQAVRESLQVANPNAAERYLRAQFMR
jgi:hypothetical protein